MAKPATDPVQRLLKRVTCPDGPSGCWIFTGAKTTGYGAVAVRRGHVALAHVLMYEHANGPKPKGFDVHHRCSNRACCNPAHLELIGHADHSRHHWTKAARATHCSRGHAWTPENTYRYASGRICRRCAIDRAAARKRRLHPPRPARTHCDSGLHAWVPESWQRLHGVAVKRCRPCAQERQRKRRAAKKSH